MYVQGLIVAIVTVTFDVDYWYVDVITSLG